MDNFKFQNSTAIIFGKDTHLQVGAETAKFSKHVLLHYGSGSIKKTGLYDAVVRSLTEAGVSYVELGGVLPNPRLSLVEEGIRLCREQDINFILAIGGGSVIDSAKAIAVGVVYEGDVWDFYSQKASAKAALPIGVVLTIAAAGSEASDSSVITNEDGWHKRGMGADCIRPTFSILNPELTNTLTPFQTMVGIADIMSHVMERYFTSNRNNDFTDRLCEATLKTAINNARIILREPNQYEARAEIMWAGTIAHNNLLGTGRIGDWASHNIEHELSGIYDVPHGAGLAVIFPAWMKYVYRENVERFVQFAVRVWDVDLGYESPEAIALEGIRRLETFFHDMGLPVRLDQLGVPSDEHFDEMAGKAVAYGPLGNFKKIYKEDILHILKLAQ
ncbi:MAG: iron-containing alcohol dehydrogenase [Paenibacillaceae bacterium]